MTKLSIILPVHEFNESVAVYLRRGFASIKMQQKIETLPPIVLVYTHTAEQAGLLEFIKEFTTPVEQTDVPLVINAVKNEGKTDFCSQINFGVANTDAEYFSILEYDDEYGTIYFNNVFTHIKDMPDVSMFLPFTIDVDDKTGSMVQIVNQTIWSKGYVGEQGTLGYLNSKALNEFSFYTIGGSVIKKSDFQASGGLKSNIKIAFSYEFLLRFIENTNKIYSLPKFGYKHIINRAGSLFAGYGAAMSMKERRFWFETAKKECHFYNDRAIDTTILTEPELTVA